MNLCYLKGGSIGSSMNGQLHISNSNFTSNSASSGGAITTITNTTIYNCIFLGNSVSGNGMHLIYFMFTHIFFFISFCVGAAILAQRATIINSTFISNTASNDGGAVYSSAVLDLQNCLFSLNQGTMIIILNVFYFGIKRSGAASNYGGAISVTYSTRISDYGSRFFNNSAGWSGGAVYYGGTASKF